MEEIQPGVFREGSKIFTKNADPGNAHYGEKLKEVEDEEYREWNPNRSKAAAAVIKGIEMGIDRDLEVLYLGAASGTTVSHFSDILTEGFVVGVEFSPDVARDLVKLAEQRSNIAPVIEDARKPEKYDKMVEDADVVFQDISQSDQAEILIKNVEYFGIDHALIAVKAQSISSSRDPEEVFEEVKEILHEEFEILDEAVLDPYEADHLFVNLKRS